MKADSGKSAGVLLNERPTSFHKTSIIETGFNDFHNMIFSFFWTDFESLKSKKLEYWNYKGLNKSKFLFELDQELLKK